MGLGTGGRPKMDTIGRRGQVPWHIGGIPLPHRGQLQQTYDFPEREAHILGT
jgi:hypothetical protein